MMKISGLKAIKANGNFAYGAHVQGTRYRFASGRSESGSYALAGHPCGAEWRNQKSAGAVHSRGLSQDMRRTTAPVGNLHGQHF